MTERKQSAWVGTVMGAVVLAWGAGGCENGGGTGTAENTPALCADGADNDGDGLRDNPAAFERNLYHVGNDLNMIAEVGTVWDEVGPLAIDYDAINTLGEGLCADNPDCYVRAPLEDYASLEAFLAYARTLPWMGEGWQSPAAFLSHLNSDNHFPRRVVWWNVHSTGTQSIISSDTAWIGFDEGKGGSSRFSTGAWGAPTGAPVTRCLPIYGKRPTPRTTSS
jgi:hypothetical protein